MKKPNGNRFEVDTFIAAILLLPHGFVSALFFGPTPEPSTCSLQTVYVRDLPPAPTPPGGGGGGGGYSFNLPDVRKNLKVLYILTIFFFFFLFPPFKPAALPFPPPRFPLLCPIRGFKLVTEVLVMFYSQVS